MNDYFSNGFVTGVASSYIYSLVPSLGTRLLAISSSMLHVIIMERCSADCSTLHGYHILDKSCHNNIIIIYVKVCSNNWLYKAKLVTCDSICTTQMT